VVTEYKTEKDPVNLGSYHDKGCRLHASCLKCPEQKCILETRGALRIRRQEERADRFYRLKVEGKTFQQIADENGVSIRTVQREFARFTSDKYAK
jgi:AraC-like DNA-binding protein